MKKDFKQKYLCLLITSKDVTFSSVFEPLNIVFIPPKDLFEFSEIKQ